VFPCCIHISTDQQHGLALEIGRFSSNPSYGPEAESVVLSLLLSLSFSFGDNAPDECATPSYQMCNHSRCKRSNPSTAKIFCQV
jgi:hypothetical protein